MGRRAEQELGRPNTMRRREPARPRTGGQRAAGPFEVWAARAWNVFNEGRPFSIVYPLLVLLGGRRGGARARRAARARSARRGGAALVLVALPVRAARARAALARRARRGAAARAVARARRCSPARSPATRSSRSSSGGRSTTTCAPARRGPTACASGGSSSTNSDPTSGNALEQLPKLLIALSAGDPAGGGARRGLAVARSAPPSRSPPALGALAARSIREAAAALPGANAPARRRRPTRARSPGAST